jgi:hypothetical protein
MIRLGNRLVDKDRQAAPWMPPIQELAETGTVGVIKLGCTTNPSSLRHRLHQPDRDGAKSSLTLSIFSGGRSSLQQKGGRKGRPSDRYRSGRRVHDAQKQTNATGADRHEEGLSAKRRKGILQPSDVAHSVNTIPEG